MIILIGLSFLTNIRKRCTLNHRATPLLYIFQDDGNLRLNSVDVLRITFLCVEIWPHYRNNLRKLQLTNPEMGDRLLISDVAPAGAATNWGEWLAGEEAVPSAVIRRQTHTGRPCGSAAFVTGLEEMTNRALNPGKRGRKAAHHSLRSLPLFNSQSNS